MSTASRLRAAMANIGEGIQGLLGLQAERDKQKSTSAMAKQKLTAEMLTSSFTEAATHYNTLLNSDSVTNPEMKPLLDSAFNNYLNAQKTRNMFFGIRTDPNMTAFELVNHEMMAFPEDKRSWTDATAELITRKYPNLDPNVLAGVEVIWKASQPKATDAQKKAASGLINEASFAGIAAESLGAFPDFFKEVGEGVSEISRSIWEGENYMTPLEGPYNWGDRTSRDYLRELFGVESTDQAAQRSNSETLEMLTGNKTTSTASPSPSFNPGGRSSVVDQILSDEEPTGETSKLIPQSAVDALGNLEDQFGNGTGGLMSLADTIKQGQEQTTSQRVKEFFDEYILYIQEYGQKQADQYMSRAFAELSDPEKQEVTEILA